MDKWIKFLRPYGVAAVCGLLMAMVWPLSESTKIIEASSIKNWTSNEQISYTDLNNNFNHLHANLGHGHGPIITANDIATNAGIRPEQTTFGGKIVHEGTYKLNPDAGATYISVNNYGSITATITATAEGYTITGSASTGTNSDAGTGIYTVLSQALGVGVTPVNGATTNRYTICWNISNSPTFASPITITYRCQDIGTAITTPTPVNPEYVSLVIYNNKAQ